MLKITLLFEFITFFIYTGMYAYNHRDATNQDQYNKLTDDMQKRILNFRPTWDIQQDYNDRNTNENITANYYPVNSAISMKDVNSGRVFTVMNDRSQGGSALSDGNIELM